MKSKTGTNPRSDCDAMEASGANACCSCGSIDSGCDDLGMQNPESRHNNDEPAGLVRDPDARKAAFAVGDSNTAAARARSEMIGVIMIRSMNLAVRLKQTLWSGSDLYKSCLWEM